jgi:hypothetical protein
MFRVDVPTGQTLKSLRVETGLSELSAAGRAYRDAIFARDTSREPDLAIVLMPHTERFETQTPYYEAKAAPSQGYEVTVAADACGSATEFGHDISRRRMGSRGNHAGDHRAGERGARRHVSKHAPIMHA